MAEKLELANEAGIFPASPESMANEPLAIYVRDGIKKLSELLPYVRELRSRFDALPRGKANIMGCNTWTQFCTEVLGRSDSAVRKALANKTALPRPKKLLLAAIERALPLCYKRIKRSGSVEEYAHMRFSISENGHLLLSGGVDGNMVEEEIPEAIILKPGGPGLMVRKDDCDFGCVNYSSDPFDFLLNVLYIIDALEMADNDPAIFFHGRNSNVEFRFSSQYVACVHPASAEPPCPSPMPAPEPVPDAEPLGEFLSDLKPGDQVIVGNRDGYQSVVAEVSEVTDSIIEVVRQGNAKTFHRDGCSDDQFKILRIATADDQAEDLALEAERAEHAEKERRRQDESRRFTELNQQVKNLLKRIPNSIRTEGSADWSGGICATFNALTLAQLENIVEALQPAQEENSAEDGSSTQDRSHSG